MTIDKQFYIYILTNKSGTLYVGITNNLIRRVWEHKEAVKEKDKNKKWWTLENRLQDKGLNFSARYNTEQLIYYEVLTDPESAIKREKEIKGWRRSKKIELVKVLNPNFVDLYSNLI